MTKKITGIALAPGMFNKVIEIPKEELESVVEKDMKSLGKIVIKHESNPVGLAELHLDESIETSFVRFDGQFLDDVEMDGEFKPEISYKGICSKCGQPFVRCNHWFDDPEVYIIAKDVELISIGYYPRNKNEKD